MNCPFCNKEMILGRVEAKQMIAFTPQGEKRVFLSMLSENGFAVSKKRLTRLSISYANANYCKECNKVIVDIYNNDK